MAGPHAALTRGGPAPRLPATVEGACSMTDDPDPERLRQLEARIARAKVVDAPERQASGLGQAQYAWRMAIELVSGLGIGFGIGYGLDMVFGTLPFMMVLFSLLGFAAGVRVMIRTAQELQAGSVAAQSAKGEGD